MQAPLTTTTTRTPGGLISTLVQGRTATLANSADPLSLTKLTETVSLNGKTTTTVYDAATRTTTSSSPMGRQTARILDALGRISRLQSVNFPAINFRYDTSGRLISVDKDAVTYTLTYDSLNQLSSITDPQGHAIHYSYDLAGRLISETMPDGRVIAHGYDANGNLISITPPGRPQHTIGYTAVNLEASYTPPNVGAGTNSTQYIYNLDKQLTQIIRPDGQSITFSYEAGGRLSNIVMPTGQINYSYDPSAGHITMINHPMAVLAMNYDGSLLTGKTLSGTINGSVSYLYNNDFRISSESINTASTIGFTYDNDGLLTGAGAQTIARIAQNGLISGTTLGNVTIGRLYNGKGELSQYTATVGGNTLLDSQITKDNIGQLIQKAETIGGLTDIYVYSYDLTGRLTGVIKNNSNIVYTYDSNGNRLSRSDANGTITATYDAQDRLITYGNASYSYTANGELQSKTVGGQTTNYSYDALGNLMTVTMPDGTLIEYLVDGENHRIGKKVNGILAQGFLYGSNLLPVAELDGAGNIVSRFIYGTRKNVPDYMVKGGVNYAIISDHLGSPRLIVDSTTGAVIQRIDYDEFGIVTKDTNPGFQPFGFAGGLYEAQTGLVRFGARDYDPVTGRWTAKDPIKFAGGTTNLYGYAANNPLKYIDPSGLAISGQGGVQAAGYFGVGGFSYSEGFAFSTDLEICTYVTICMRVGPSLFVGAGGVFGGGLSTNLSSEPSVGLGCDIGWGGALGGQVSAGLGDQGIDSLIAAKGHGGVGYGYSCGIDVCWQEMTCLPKKPPQCKIK